MFSFLYTLKERTFQTLKDGVSLEYPSFSERDFLYEITSHSYFSSAVTKTPGKTEVYTYSLEGSDGTLLEISSYVINKPIYYKLSVTVEIDGIEVEDSMEKRKILKRFLKKYEKDISKNLKKLYNRVNMEF